MGWRWWASLGFLALDKDRARTGELVAKLGHSCLDFVKDPGGHHAQRCNLIGPAQLDPVLLEDGPQHRCVPERGARDRPGHLHYRNAPSGDGALSRIVAAVLATGPVGVKPDAGLPAIAAPLVSLPQVVSLPGSGAMAAVTVLSAAKPAAEAATAMTAARFFISPSRAQLALSEHPTTSGTAASRAPLS
jgi:hypothetical protein